MDALFLFLGIVFFLAWIGGLVMNYSKFRDRYSDHSFRSHIKRPLVRRHS